jgi:peptidoglycan/LPS O-acetylase OafA/YrhL
MIEHQPRALLGQRLVSVDALRGVAALGVVLYHTNAIPGVDRRLLFGDAVDAAMLFGKYGVWLFFVISGFCIHLQWVRSHVDVNVRPLGFAAFWKRRIRRLYPPYLATLVFYIWLRHSLGELPYTALSAWKVGLHMFMLQNLDTRALSTMNNVYWTLAVEEQLYLLYFVFLAIRQRWGWTTTLTLAAGARLGWFALAMLLHRLWGVDIVVTQAAAAQWLIWILGALAVEAAFGVTRLPRWTRRAALGAATLAVASLIAWAQNYWLSAGLFSNALWLTGDLVWGLGFFVLLNWSVGYETAWAATRRVPRWVAGLATVGIFSYSLYLTHEIVQWRLWPPVAARLAQTGHLLPQVVVMGLMAAASLAFARIFFVFFERPFLTRRRPSGRSPLVPAIPA